MTKDREATLREDYERRLREYGDNPLGVGWPNPQDAELRYRVMLDVIRPGAATNSILDFGCGTGALLENIRHHGRRDIHYTGTDNSEKHLALCRQKFPDVNFISGDILNDAPGLGEFDYIVANGVFTLKASLTHAEMFGFLSSALQKLWLHARLGMAFNVMTKHVDWERDDLFHVGFDEMASFLKAHISRHFLFRSEYGLWEYTVYVYRNPQRG
ncbi:MAG TPA: class I SAM-dependent methyltransferase [Gammaproteobacteria bacterium]|nr:class I SAM-dependent methyltransferase [Gammaproteobacteria bacterium]